MRPAGTIQKCHHRNRRCDQAGLVRLIPRAIWRNRLAIAELLFKKVCLPKYRTFLVFVG
jgi:hypothetical protein